MAFKSTRTDRLSPVEREIVDRFERGLIDAAEAGRLLIESVHHHREAAAPVHEAAAEETDALVPDETSEEAKARALVERIARDVYEGPA
jgi:hypothetical protein